MKDEDLLKKLYELQNFNIRNKELKEYIEKWIHDTQLDIASESIANIGYGSEIKTYRKWLKYNRTHLPCMQGMVKLSRKEYIIGTQYYAVCSPRDLKLPEMHREESIKQAEALLYAINQDQIRCTERVALPARSELDAIIKMHKATPAKQRRSKRALYKFEPNNSVTIWVDAEYLMDMLTIFTNEFGFCNPHQKSMSHIYFSKGNFRGILCPVKVDEAGK